MTDAPVRRLGTAVVPAPPGVRVVLDARPLQTPERAPLTATYLDALLRAYDDEPIAGESFAMFLRSDLDDPTRRYRRLEVVGRRLLPPTRLLRSAAMTVDPFLLRGATLGAAWRAERGGAAGAVYHAVGGALPIAPDLPVVVTLLDLAPWEMPDSFQGSLANRFGQRLRAQQLREASAVLVGSQAAARAARRLLHLHEDRIRIVPLAPRAAFAAAAGQRRTKADTVALQERLGLAERYLVFSGRFDARQDLGTLLKALAGLAAAGRPTELGPAVPWPPRVLLVGASPDDRASLARAAAREGIGESLAYAPALAPDALAGLVRAARAVILPVLSDAAGLPVIEAIACGTPVVATAVGPLPELIGPAGLLVGPGEQDRLAVALATIWADDGVHQRLVTAAKVRAKVGKRTWADVARDTRSIYADVGVRRERPAGG
ncbi:MAG: glycosyltransferase [Chloroflexi bacterium]|nr:glycosyltransferase [Chloroflexota bacterium]